MTAEQELQLICSMIVLLHLFTLLRFVRKPRKLSRVFLGVMIILCVPVVGALIYLFDFSSE